MINISAPFSAPNALAEPDYRGLIEAAGDLIYTLDLDGRFTYVNTASHNILEYSPESLIGRHFDTLLTKASKLIARGHFSRGIAGDNRYPFFEVEAITSTGVSRFLEIRAASLYKGAQLIGRQGIARDIGELKTLQASLSERSQRISLLENQARIAMTLYTRLTTFALESEADVQALEQSQKALRHADAERLGLSESDLEIVALLANGHSNREIATAIFRSENTVKDRLKKLMQCLGARRRAEVVATAARLGLINYP